METQRVMGNLALALTASGKLQEAEALLRRGLAAASQPDHAALRAILLTNLSICMQSQQRLEEAESVCAEAMNLRRKVLGNSHRDTLFAMHNLAQCQVALRRFTEAAELLEEVVDLAREHLDADDWALAEFLFGYGECLRRTERRDEAESLLLESQELFTRLLGERDPKTLRARDAVRRLRS